MTSQAYLIWNPGVMTRPMVVLCSQYDNLLTYYTRVFPGTQIIPLGDAVCIDCNVKRLEEEGTKGPQGPD